jgi:uncharacterized protein (TIRG00374 family)
MSEPREEGRTLPEQAPGAGRALTRGGRVALGALVSLVFLLLALRGVDLQQVWQTLKQVNLALALLALTLSTGVNVAKAVRWRVILRPHAPLLTLHRLFAVLMIGQAMNTFAPLRFGDVARIYMLKAAGSGTILYSVVVEKSLDSLTLVALLFVVALVMPVPPWLKESGILLSLGLVAVLVALLLAGRSSRHLSAAGSWLEAKLSPLGRLDVARRVRDAASVLRSLGERHVLMPAVAWTAVCWVLGVGANIALFPAVGLDMTNPVLAGAFLIIVLYIGAIVPASPGKLGIFDYLCVISLALFGVEKTPALAYAIVLHLVSYGPPAMLGAYYVWRESQPSIRAST